MKLLSLLAGLFLTVSAHSSPIDLVREASPIIRWDVDRYLTALELTYNRLQTKQRILELDAEARKSMGLPDQICHDTKKKQKDCHPFLGFYIPMTDTIVIDKALPDDKKKWVLLHELIHATQYFLRLPIDMSGLLNSELPQEKLFEYLSFFYEAQANWYTLTASMNKLWMPERKSGAKLKAIGSLKAYGFLITFGATIAPMKKSFQSLLPEVDQIRGWRNPYYHENADDILSLRELVILKTWRGNINPAVNIDLKFHQKFTHALETSYYGSLDFLLAPGAEDQKIFKKMHDRYYSFLSLPEEQWQQCLAQINSQVEAHKIPLIAWLSSDISDYAACDFEDLSFFKQKNKVQEILQSQSFFPGTEGSGPPSLILLPQIEVLPKKHQKPAGRK